jgi:hypothetical protein
MTYWKMPPIAKVYEALTAVADDRVRMIDDGRAEVVSSSGSKTYAVQWQPEFSTVSSNDNASFWQGYLGYPIIAVLMKAGKLTYDPKAAEALRGIEWKRINDEHKRDYEGAVAEVLRGVEASGADPKSVVTEVERIYGALEQERLGKGRSSEKPPK